MLVTTLSSGTSLANDVIYLEKDKPAPFTGYLFSVDKERETRLKLIETDFNLKRLDITTKIVEVQENELKILETRLNNYKDQNDKLAKQLQDTREFGFWQKTLYFLGGAVITGAISYGVVKTLK